MRGVLILAMALLLAAPAAARASDVYVHVFLDANGNGQFDMADDDEENALPATVTLTASDGTTQTSADGAFKDVPPGPTTLTLGNEVAPVAPADGRLSFTLGTGEIHHADFSARGAVVSGRVVTPRALVTLTGPRTSVLQSRRDGTFDTGAATLPAGDYTVTARRPGYTAASAGGTVRPGGTLRLAPITLAPGTPVAAAPPPGRVIIGGRAGQATRLLDRNLDVIPGSPRMPAGTIVADASPDGASIAAFDGDLHVYGPHPRTFPKPVDAPIATVSWITPDHILLVYRSVAYGDTPVAVVDLTTGLVTRTNVQGYDLGTSRFGDRQVVATTTEGRALLTVLDPDGTVVSQFDAGGRIVGLTANRAIVARADLFAYAITTIDPVTLEPQTVPITAIDCNGWSTPFPAAAPAGCGYLLDPVTLQPTAAVGAAINGDGRGGVLTGNARYAADGRRLWRTRRQASVYPMAFGQRVYLPVQDCERRHRTQMVIRDADSGRVLRRRQGRWHLQAPAAGDGHPLNWANGLVHDARTDGYFPCAG